MTAPPPPDRPRRGTPEQTRERLVEAASIELEQRGYFGTDTNRIAAAAGYAPGTFYKHFPDKRAVFLAVYDAWVDVEWAGIAALVERAETPRALATHIVEWLVEHHRTWRGFRGSLRALVLTDGDVRGFHRERRAAQLTRMLALRPGRASAARRRRGALLLLVVERVCDAIADDEITSLSLSEADARAFLIGEIQAFITA